MNKKYLHNKPGRFLLEIVFLKFTSIFLYINTQSNQYTIMMYVHYSLKVLLLLQLVIINKIAFDLYTKPMGIL